MLKKILISLGVVTVLTFVSCGGESSKEAKEILQKILTIIGFPPEVITNICQTSNSSDICEGMKLHKLESSKTKTWQKIKETGVGQYLLETNNPCAPILLELTDDDIEYDSGEFFLKFSGVEYGETSKELSILEAMVDASYLSDSSVVSIKTINNVESKNRFYATLYKDLKTNINSLKIAGLTKTQSIRGTLKEMAEELKEYGMNSTLSTEINACSDDIACVDGELTELSSKLIIDANETGAIVEDQKDNNAPLSVREVSCEENQFNYIYKDNDNLFLSKNNKNIQLTENNHIYTFKVSPNGNKVAYILGNYNYYSTSSVWIMDINGSNKRKVSEKEITGYQMHGTGFGWSPNSQKILMSTDSKLISIDINSKEENIILNQPPKTGFYFHNIIWKSNKIAFEIGKAWDYDNEIYIINEDGSNLQLIVEDGNCYERLYTLSEDASYVIYGDDFCIEKDSGRGGSLTAYKLDINNLNKINLSKKTDKLDNESDEIYFHPNKDLILTRYSKENKNIYKVNKSTFDITPIDFHKKGIILLP